MLLRFKINSQSSKRVAISNDHIFQTFNFLWAISNNQSALNKRNCREQAISILYFDFLIL